jgi:hypothetical protein
MLMIIFYSKTKTKNDNINLLMMEYNSLINKELFSFLGCAYVEAC